MLSPYMLKKYDCCRNKAEPQSDIAPSRQQSWWEGSRDQEVVTDVKDRFYLDNEVDPSDLTQK